MDDKLIAQIQSFTLNARAALEKEAGQQLEGIYGWLPDGLFEEPSRYPALNQIEEAAETRRRLENYAEEEKTVGFAPKKSRAKLVRETAFTWLNRLVALRMMEERKIIKSTVGKLDKSNSFIFWLTADGNEEMYELHQKGALPQNEIGEGPSDMAYRNFILWQCGQLAEDVSVLFDPGNLSSRLFPRPPVLKNIVESMNREELVDAWQTGNEETVGWVYQAFNAEELQAAFTAARVSKKKFEAKDIPSVTQLFTLRWVVNFLVENTLGRLWMEMHPDSRLRDKLAYLVPFSGSARTLKFVKDITFLDPSCGSMHFGLVAFDLFVEMYREELEKAGQEGWPERSSVASIDEIPASIISNNIYGIDLDLRAVQLSALTLLLKARTLNNECTFSDRNLACANVEAITGGRLDEFISNSNFSHPIYERILRAMALSLKDSEQLGSLLRLERTLKYLIAEERKKVDAEKQIQFSFPGVTQEQFATPEGVQEFFEILHEHVLRHLDNFVRESRSQEIESGHFAAETEKGLRFLGIVSAKYDVVATNPPYLSGGKMNKHLANLIKENYSEGKSDLYAAFILRNQELVKQHGYIGMLTMHSFMFISSYESMRDTLRNNICVEILAHFGGGLFAVGNPGTLQTAGYVLKKEKDQKKRQENHGTYFRLIREKNSDEKMNRFKEAIANIRSGEKDPIVYQYKQGDFEKLPRAPWAYWAGDFEYRIFKNNKSMSSLFKIDMGLKTSNNFRFVRWWWEIGFDQIGYPKSRNQAVIIDKKWFPYAKGGKTTPYSSDVPHVVNWKKDGSEIKRFLVQQYPYLNGNTEWCTHNEDLYFLPCVVWAPVSSRGLQARWIPPGTITSNASYGIFANKENAISLLIFMNSIAGKYLAKILCPTINHNKGDIALLPIPSNVLNNSKLKDIGESLIEIVSINNRHDETSPLFSGLMDRQIGLEKFENLQRDANAILFALIGAEDKQDFIKDFVESPLIDSSHVEINGSDESNENENSQALEAGASGEIAICWISYAFGAMLGRYSIGEPEGLGRGAFDKDTAAAIQNLIDEDGVIVSESGHPQDCTFRTLRCLEHMLGKDKAYTLIRDIAGSYGDPEDLLRGFLDRFTGTPDVSFWRHHYQLYRNRPIYWPLQSPKRKFTVWVFQERFTRDTLFKVRSEFVDTKARLLESQIKEINAKADQSAGAKKRALEKEASQLADTFDDVQEFSKRLNAIIQRGYTPHIDDGVLLNAAPLWEILPSWPDTKKAWKDLEDEKYDWAHQAMEYWPDRVKEKCENNKSFAIAHGMA